MQLEKKHIKAHSFLLKLNKFNLSQILINALMYSISSLSFDPL